MIIKFFSHLIQSLSKLKSTNSHHPPGPQAALQQFTSVSCAQSECMCVFLLPTSAPPLHCSTHRKEIKLKFILQIGYDVLLFGMFFL